jgi:hypothetical protein
MPGVYGDLANLARNSSMEHWTQGTNTTTSGAEAPSAWVLGVGTGSTLNVSRASTGMDSGAFCAGVAYTHVIASTLSQVVGALDDMKGETVSFSARVASATAGMIRPYISTDGGTTKQYGNYNSGAGASTYEILKVEGIAVPSNASALHIGLEFRRTGTVLIDAAALTLGSAAETDYAPRFAKGAAWTQTSGATVRNVDMTGTASTLVVQALGTLVRDLQAAGILP